VGFGLCDSRISTPRASFDLKLFFPDTTNLPLQLSKKPFFLVKISKKIAIGENWGGGENGRFRGQILHGTTRDPAGPPYYNFPAVVTTWVITWMYFHPA